MMLTMIVRIVDINVEKKKTRASVISSLRKVKRSENTMRESIPIHLNRSRRRNTPDWRIVSIAIAKENQENFPKINSHLSIGFERIKNIVFPSISLKRSWLQTKSTQMSQNTSIIASPKSTITLFASPIVSCPRARENTINTNAKNTIT
jgi:hypothetical protein